MFWQPAACLLFLLLLRYFRIAGMQGEASTSVRQGHSWCRPTILECMHDASCRIAEHAALFVGCSASQLTCMQLPPVS
jgi:hypothetical protein